MHWHRLPEGVGVGPCPWEMFQNCGDVAHGNMWARSGGLGLGLEILEVFSNLHDPMILFRDMVEWVEVGHGDLGCLFQPS